MIYNHLSEGKMIETRDTDVTLFNIIFRKFVETNTPIDHALIDHLLHPEIYKYR